MDTNTPNSPADLPIERLLSAELADVAADRPTGEPLAELGESGVVAVIQFESDSLLEGLVWTLDSDGQKVRTTLAEVCSMFDASDRSAYVDVAVQLHTNALIQMTADTCQAFDTYIDLDDDTPESDARSHRIAMTMLRRQLTLFGGQLGHAAGEWELEESITFDVHAAMTNVLRCSSLVDGVTPLVEPVTAADLAEVSDDDFDDHFDSGGKAL